MNKIRKTTALMLVVMVLLGVLALPASAAELQPLTEHYVTDLGKTAAPSKESTTDAKPAPKIENYTFIKHSTETTHVYSPEHIVYVIGYPDGGVKVEQNMTRAEAATVLYRLYNGNYPAQTRRMEDYTFNDMNSDDWFYREVEMLFNTGVIEGTKDGRFRPNEYITRAEFATMASCYENLSYSDNAIFADVQPGHFAYSHINAAAERGWIKGYPDGTFRPDSHITRAEVMTFVNRLFNRPVRVEDLPENVNPYNDITEAHWAYCEAMEATIKHDIADWHGTTYISNTITEKYVDLQGEEIAPPLTIEGLENHHPLIIHGHVYLGYTTVITFVYSSGKPIPGITKTAGVKKAEVGDSITYTVELTNDKDATDAWVDIVMTDAMPEHMTLVHGSVYIDGKHVDYSYDKDILTIEVGDIEIGKKAIINFDALVLSTAYGETIINTAVADSINNDPVEDSDEGVIISQGRILPNLTKKPDVTEALVGDVITYTITAGNGNRATYPWKNAVITDVIPSGLSFVDGSVYVDGRTHAYTYEGKTLYVELGDIASGKSHVITFKVTALEESRNTTVYNTAIGKGDNIPDVPAPDTGVEILDGRAEPSATKLANRDTARVGDTIIYTITARNGRHATADWKNAVMSDIIPDELSFVQGSVFVSGETRGYSYDPQTRKLTVRFGNVQAEESVEIRFSATVNEETYGKTVYNTAVLSGDNTTDFEVPDKGVIILAGRIDPSATKSIDKKTANIGDTVTYTVTAKNSLHATVAWEKAVMSDVIPEGLTFAFGSVFVNGSTAKDYAYNTQTRKLVVNFGDVQPGETVTISFSATVNDDAFNKTIRNTAILSGDNIFEPLEASDEGVTIGKGISEGTATKSVSATHAMVDDTLTYTIEVKNSKLASYVWENAVISDSIPEHLTFVSGSLQINGKSSSEFSYDGKSELKVYLGDMEPGDSALVTFRVTVDKEAEGEFIVNTAYVSGDNHETLTAPDNGVQIGAKAPMPTVSKIANVSKAAVGDTITYTVRAANSIKAPVEWQNVVMSDTIPLGMDFVDGSVYVGGILTNYTFAERILTVPVGDIVPGEMVEITFKVVINEDARGNTIENVAMLDSDNHDSVPAPDKGIKVDEGNPVPTVTKTASVAEATVGSSVTYTITVDNSITATADWRNVIVSDVIPAEFDFKYGSVFVNGVSKSYIYAGRALTVPVGDLIPGQTATVTFSVTVTERAVGKTVFNTATVSSDNNTPETATDNGVRVPDEQFGGDSKTLYGAKTVDRVSVRSGELITYTIVAGNSSENNFTWNDVEMYDIIDTALSKLVIDSVTIDGRKATTAERSYHDGQLIVHLGAMEPGQEMTIKFQVLVTAEANGERIFNTATLKGSNADGGTFNTTVRINLTTPVPVDPDPNQFSDVHSLLYRGFGTTQTVTDSEGNKWEEIAGHWMPDAYMSRTELAELYWRLMCKPEVTKRVTIGDVTTDFWAYNSIQYALENDVLFLDQYDNFNMYDRMTQADFGRMLKAVLGDDFGFTGTARMKRIDTAIAVVKYTSRTVPPVTNGHPLPSFPDVSSTHPYYWTIMEVSTDHDWYVDSHDTEYWD